MMMNNTVNQSERKRKKQHYCSVLKKWSGRHRWAFLLLSFVSVTDFWYSSQQQTTHIRATFQGYNKISEWIFDYVFSSCFLR